MKPDNNVEVAKKLRRIANILDERGLPISGLIVEGAADTIEDLDSKIDKAEGMAKAAQAVVNRYYALFNMDIPTTDDLVMTLSLALIEWENA